MALSLRYIGFSCIVFLALQQVATGLTCYSCTSCGSSYSTTSSTSSSAMCYKYVYSLGVISYTSRGVSSSCSSGSDGLGGTYYCCSTDNCNGSISLSGSLGLAFAVIAALGIFKGMMNN